MKEVSIKYYECVCVFLPELPGMQIKSALHGIILSSVACLARPYVSHYLINSTIFRKKFLNIKCVC
jgi:hypothetical protein